MKFRYFLTLVSFLGFFTNSALAADPFAPPIPLYKEGQQYITAFPEETADNPTIIEFFSFGCPHCFNSEGQVERLVKSLPESVNFIKVPVGFGRPDWVLFARAYYISKELKLSPSFSTAFFNQIHTKHQPPKNKQQLAQFFATQGVAETDFNKAYSSFYVESAIKKADKLARKFKISGVPSFLVNNRYKPGKQLKSEKEFNDVLVALALKDFP